MATGTMRGANNTVANAPTPATLLNYGQGEGKLSFIMDRVVIDDTYDAGSILKMGGKIPKGSMPLFGKVNYSTGSSTATLKIGSADNDDLFGTATDLNATNEQDIWPTVPNTPLEADTEVEILTAAAALASNDVLTLVIFFAKP